MTDVTVVLIASEESDEEPKPAEADPTYFHAPPALETVTAGATGQQQSATTKKAFTQHVSTAIVDQMRRNDRITVMTAAMCQGNKLEPIRDEFPERFFDTGI